MVAAEFCAKRRHGARTTAIEGAETIARSAKALLETVQPGGRRRVTERVT